MRIYQVNRLNVKITVLHTDSKQQTVQASHSTIQFLNRSVMAAYFLHVLIQSILTSQEIVGSSLASQKTAREAALEMLCSSSRAEVGNHCSVSGGTCRG